MSKDLIRLKISGIFNFFIVRNVGRESLVSFFKKFFFTALKEFLKLEKNNIKIFFNSTGLLKLALVLKVVRKVIGLTYELSLKRAISFNNSIRLGDSVMLPVKKEDYLKILSLVETKLIFFFKKKLLNENFKKITLRGDPSVQFKGEFFPVQGILRRGGTFRVIFDRSFFSINLLKIKRKFQSIGILKVLLQQGCKSFILLIGGKDLNRGLSFFKKCKLVGQVFLWNNNIVYMLKIIISRNYNIRKVFIDVKKKTFSLKVYGYISKVIEKPVNTILNSKVTFNIK